MDKHWSSLESGLFLPNHDINKINKTLKKSTQTCVVRLNAQNNSKLVFTFIRYRKNWLLVKIYKLKRRLRRWVIIFTVTVCIF